MPIKGFIKLLKRYSEGSLTGRTREAVDIWFHSIQKDPVEKNSREEIRERIWTGILQGREDAGETIVSTEKSFLKRNFRWSMAAAAVVLALAGVGYFLTASDADKDDYLPEAIATHTSDWSERINTGLTSIDIKLEDGSKVVLEPGARIRYPASFSTENRTVYLSGNGFFDVVRDTERPFLVYAGAVVTRVLGTSFSIRSIAETGGTEVAVITGKVMVERNKLKEGNPHPSDRENRVILTPNKKVTFFENSELYVTGLVENPVIVSNREEFLKPGAFDFDETPLSEVLAKLEKAYGVEITLSNDEMLDCPVTADLTSDNLFGKIEIIGAVLNAEYEITGSSILLSGGGCTPSKSVKNF